MPPVANPIQHVTNAALWERFRSFGDQKAREELLRQHVSLVHFVARRFLARAPVMEYDEMVSAGALGLLRAIDGYDPGRGFAFSTYAVARIRGAILDDFRRRDLMPRSRRTRCRRLAAARAQLQARLLRAPRAAEIARELGLDLEAYWRWCDELDAPTQDGGMERSGRGVLTQGRGDRPGPELGTPEDQSPDQRLLAEEAKSSIRAAIEKLPEREGHVLALCYFEELPLSQVGTLLGVTESRVSQLRQQACRRLRGILEA